MVTRDFDSSSFSNLEASGGDSTGIFGSSAVGSRGGLNSADMDCTADSLIFSSISPSKPGMKMSGFFFCVGGNEVSDDVVVGETIAFDVVDVVEEVVESVDLFKVLVVVAPAALAAAFPAVEDVGVVLMALVL